LKAVSDAPIKVVSATKPPPEEIKPRTEPVQAARPGPAPGFPKAESMKETADAGTVVVKAAKPQPEPIKVTARPGPAPSFPKAEPIRESANAGPKAVVAVKPGKARPEIVKAVAHRPNPAPGLPKTEPMRAAPDAPVKPAEVVIRPLAVKPDAETAKTTARPGAAAGFPKAEPMREAASDPIKVVSAVPSGAVKIPPAKPAPTTPAVVKPAAQLVEPAPVMKREQPSRFRTASAVPVSATRVPEQEPAAERPAPRPTRSRWASALIKRDARMLTAKQSLPARPGIPDHPYVTTGIAIFHDEVVAPLPMPKVIKHPISRPAKPSASAAPGDALRDKLLAVCAGDARDVQADSLDDKGWQLRFKVSRPDDVERVSSKVKNLPELKGVAFHMAFEVDP
jgi:hypothetical protein